jgi:hypothetical protein
VTPGACGNLSDLRFFVPRFLADLPFRKDLPEYSSGLEQLAKLLGGCLRGEGVHGEASNLLQRSPDWCEFDVPMIILGQAVPLFFPQPHSFIRRHVENEFHRDAGSDGMQSSEHGLKGPGQICHFGLGSGIEAVAMSLWNHPGLEGATGAEGGIDEEVGGLFDDPRPLLPLLADYVAVKTALLIPEVSTSGGQLLPEVIEDDRCAEDPREGVADPIGRCPFPAQDQDSPDLGIPVKIPYAIPVNPQHALYRLGGQEIPRITVFRVLDHDFTGSTPRNAVEDPQSLTPDVPLDLEKGSTLRNHADEPFRTIGRLAVGAVGDDLRRGFCLVSRTERTGAVTSRLRCFVPHEDPPARGGIFS